MNYPAALTSYAYALIAVLLNVALGIVFSFLGLAINLFTWAALSGGQLAFVALTQWLVSIDGGTNSRRESLAWSATSVGIFGQAIVVAALVPEPDDTLLRALLAPIPATSVIYFLVLIAALVLASLIVRHSARQHSVANADTTKDWARAIFLLAAANFLLPVPVAVTSIGSSWFKPALLLVALAVQYALLVRFAQHFPNSVRATRVSRRLIVLAAILVAFGWALVGQLIDTVLPMLPQATRDASTPGAREFMPQLRDSVFLAVGVLFIAFVASRGIRMLRSRPRAIPALHAACPRMAAALLLLLGLCLLHGSSMLIATTPNDNVHEQNRAVPNDAAAQTKNVSPKNPPARESLMLRPQTTHCSEPAWLLGDTATVVVPVVQCEASGYVARNAVLVVVGLSSGEGSRDAEENRARQRALNFARTVRSQHPTSVFVIALSVGQSSAAGSARRPVLVYVAEPLKGNNPQAAIVDVMHWAAVEFEHYSNCEVADTLEGAVTFRACN